MRNGDTHQRDHDRVGHLVRLIGEERELQAGAREGCLGVFHQMTDHHAQRLPGPRAGDCLDEPQRRRERQRRDRRERPGRRIAGQP